MGINLPLEKVALLLERLRPVSTGPQSGPTPAAAVDPLHIQKANMARTVNGLVSRLHYASNNAMERKDIYIRLTQFDGMRHKEATLEQLTKRAQVLQQWIKDVCHAAR